MRATDLRVATGVNLTAPRRGGQRGEHVHHERLLVETHPRGADEDKKAMEAAVESGDLDRVILRPAFLSDDPATGHVRVFDAASGEKAHAITRADLAAFMVAQVGDDAHLRRAVTNA